MGIFDFVKGIGKKIQHQQNLSLLQPHLLSLQLKKLPINY
jgi:hypothetical protein